MIEKFAIVCIYTAYYASLMASLLSLKYNLITAHDVNIIFGTFILCPTIIYTILTYLYTVFILLKRRYVHNKYIYDDRYNHVKNYEYVIKSKYHDKN